MRDFFGINGHTIQFKPDLYKPVCSVVRDYHPVEWDLGKKTAELPPFPLAKNRVDWNAVYGSWREKGWTIDVSLMFESIKRTNWTEIEKDARAYGRSFAKEFGPSGTRKPVDSVEIGNEPGNWSDADYARIFSAMAQGIREGDPKLKIVTCNLTTGPSGNYEKSVNCVTNFGDLIDVLNVHSYAQLDGWPTWRRSFPENPKLPHYLQDVEKLCRWRDDNAPGKPVWVTEFGYDSSTKKPPNDGASAKWVGVSDVQQAQWLVRSILVFSAMPVDRAYIYFFNDEDGPSLHASSGITRHFQPKPAYYALAHLQQMLGECRFHGMITNQSDTIRAQEYQNGSNKVVWVVWSPTGSGTTSTITLHDLPGRLVETQRMPLTKLADSSSSASISTEATDRGVQLRVDESPAYLVFEKQ